MAELWGVFEDERSGAVHVIPCHSDGEMYYGHEVAKDCPCHPRFEDGLWVHRENS